MQTSKLFAGVLAASMLVASSQAIASPAVATHAGPPAVVKALVWGTFACASIVILTAYTVGRAQGRELTTQEAMSCGIRYWLNPPRTR